MMMSQCLQLWAVKVYMMWQYCHIIMEVLPPVTLPITAHPPGPPRNLTFHYYLDFENNEFRGNATWLGPEFPEGELIEYRYVLSFVSASTIVGGTLCVEVRQMFLHK